MAPKKQREVYDDWSGGHWGTRGPFKADKNQYRAVNVQVYANGTIGPRPGWKLLETTGTAPAPSAGSGSEMYGMACVPGTVDNGYLVFISKSDPTACKALDLDTNVWGSALGIGAPPRDYLVETTNGGNVWSHQADWVLVGATDYENLRTASSGAISYPDSFAPRMSVAYKNRMYSWGDSTYTNRIYYSANGNFGSFTSGDYFTISLAGTIVNAWSLGDSLLILVLTAAIGGAQPEGEWWSLTGANPLTGTLRLLSKDTWPAAAVHSTVYKNTMVFQDSLYDHGIMAHNGSELNTSGLSHLTASYGNKRRGAISTGAVSTVGEPAIVLPYNIGVAGASSTGSADPTGDVIGDYYDNGTQAWEFVNGVWTKAVYWNGATEVDYPLSFFRGVVPWDSYKLIAATNDTEVGSGEYKFFTRDLTLNRPVRTANTYSDPLEEHPDVPSTLLGEVPPNILWLPAIQSEIGGGVRIRRVIVDVDYWKGSDMVPADIADLQCSVANYRLEDGWFAETEVQTSDSTGFETTTLGSDNVSLNPRQARIIFRFEDTPFYSACAVRFANLRNIAIDRVTVDYFEQEGER